MDPIRPPDTPRRERLVGSDSRPSRRARVRPRQEVAVPLSPAVITWDVDEEDDEDAQFRRAMEASLREETLRQERDKALRDALLRERLEEERLEAMRLEEERLCRHREEGFEKKYGLVQSRLRLMRHPSDPLVEEWLALMEREWNGSSEPLCPAKAEELRRWVEKRATSSPTWNVLGDLLNKN